VFFARAPIEKCRGQSPLRHQEDITAEQERPLEAVAGDIEFALVVAIRAILVAATRESQHIVAPDHPPVSALSAYT